MFSLIAWLTQPKIPSFGDIKIVQNTRSWYYEVHVYDKKCFGDGDEWIEWSKVYSTPYRDLAVGYVKALVVRQDKPAKKRLIMYKRAGK
jgi:hypothetical protein